MERPPVPASLAGPGKEPSPADLLRRKARQAVPPHPGPPTASRELITVGEDEEEGDAGPGPLPGSGPGGHAKPAPLPWAKPAAVPAGAFAIPRPRGAGTAPRWESYWDRKLEVHLPGRGGTFNVYLAGGGGPVVLCLHGGGYTGLTWSLMARKLRDKYRVVAPDLRGHGLTVTDADTDFSRETMAEDIVALWEALFGAGEPRPPAPPPAAAAAPPAGEAPGGAAAGTAGADAAAAAAAAAPQAAAGPAAAATTGGSTSGGGNSGGGNTGVGGADGEVPATVLVGHSMGGGLAVWAAAGRRIRRLEGVVVIDVVEGTALAALPHMRSVLAARPASFAAPEEAVAWALRAGMSRNREAAALSLPSQLARDQPAARGSRPPAQAAAAGGDGAPGGGGGGGGGHVVEAEGGAGAGREAGRWRWRTPLELSRPSWEGWYTGLSEAFLQLPCPKALILAGTDRLDRSLTIGQMQGRFQLILMPTAGHAIHEDEPDRTGDHVLQFLRRFRVGEPPLQFPRPPPGTRPVLPQVAGPVLGAEGG